MNKKPLGAAAAPEPSELEPGMFRWRTRVTTGVPEVGGMEVETLSSHILDENAHPQYLKKGQAVPTGQEYTIVGRHNSYLLAHMTHLARRDELIRTKEEYDSAKNDAPYVDDANNYSKTAPKRHIMTARALGDVLNEYQRLDSIIRDCGDGTNLIYIDHAGAGHVSTANIGTLSRPVYLKNGRVTALNCDAVLTENNQTINGRKTFSIVPNVTIDAADPSADTDLVTVAYLKKASRIPIGFHVITTRSFDTSAKVATALGYGTWSLAAEVGLVAYMWVRTA